MWGTSSCNRGGPWTTDMKRKAEDSAAEATVDVSLTEALAKTAAALKQIGWDDEAAQVQAEIMVAAETCGNNQGLVKMFKPQLMAPASGAEAPVLERETSNSAIVNGRQAPGMLALVKAVDTAIGKAKGGVASVGVYNTSTSSGQVRAPTAHVLPGLFSPRPRALLHSSPSTARARRGPAWFASSPPTRPSLWRRGRARRRRSAPTR